MRVNGNSKKRAVLIAKGFCIGTADIIPGVSGGTMAFILGIYGEFIAAIKSFDLAALTALLRLEFRQAAARPHFGFILPLLLGIVAALMFFTRVVQLPQLLLDYPEQIFGLFFGLIGGSILVLLKGHGWISPQGSCRGNSGSSLWLPGIQYGPRADSGCRLVHIYRRRAVHLRNDAAGHFRIIHLTDPE